MFSIYIQAGEFEIEAAEEVLRLFRDQKFREGDYFTIGRDQVEYLEIFYLDGAFALNHIAPNSDEGKPVADGVEPELMERVVEAFCGGGWKWQTLLRDKQPAAEASEFENPQSLTPGKSDPQTAAMFDDPAPIGPKGVRFATILWLLLLVGLIAGAASYFWYAHADGH